MTDIARRYDIEKKIFLIRGKNVMLDRDLAELYGVPTKRLIEQMKRNKERFPDDFMFRLTVQEFLRCQNGTSNLRSQFATSSWGGRRYLPYAFTEQGVAMLSSVLNSKRAIQVNIQIMRTFVELRKMVISHKELLKKIEDMEKRYDSQFKAVFQAIRRLMDPIEKPKKRIGFHSEIM